MKIVYKVSSSSFSKRRKRKNILFSSAQKVGLLDISRIPEEIEEQSSSLITLQSKTLPASQKYPMHGDNTLEAGVLVEETLREVPLLETIVPEFQE